MDKYSVIVDYFRNNPFGSERPVLKLLSLLPPQDRCSILESVLAFDPLNFDIYNKLSMAYLKNGELKKAHILLKNGFDRGMIDHFNYQDMKDKIDFMSTTNPNGFGSAQNYQKSLLLIEQHEQMFRDADLYEQHDLFFKVLRTFCRNQ